MSAIMTGSTKADCKWIGSDGGWKIGRTLLGLRDRLYVQEYHGGATYWVHASIVDEYPERAIPEPEVRQ